jgi:hypothetical protein
VLLPKNPRGDKMAADAKRWLGSNIFEIILRVVVGLTVVAALFLFFRQNSLATCQSAYNQAYAEYALDSRNSREADDKVRDELFMAIYDARNLDSVAAQKQIDSAFVKYFTTIDLTNKQRKDNPPPPLPNDYCG